MPRPPKRSMRNFRARIRLPLVSYEVPMFFRRTLIAALLLCTWMFTACDRGRRATSLDRPAPQFTLQDGAQQVSLASFRGNVVILHFWATWCAPCIEELPSLNDLQASLPPHVKLLAIAADTDTVAYANFLASHPLAFRSIDDPANVVNQRYGTVAFPETYLIDKQGRIRRKLVGPQNWSSPDLYDTLSKLASE
jgi:cytochrome c biogenesis protein CcmG/thiol:disulfide interchange protein DsbE